ncbi:MAG TPA: restriction endonuclease subunit S [Terriglobales bacterium]|nr:restriction endonuclease subunit S [Terriglobales bacterium]
MARATKNKPADAERSPDKLPEGWTLAFGADLFGWSSGKFLPKSKQTLGTVPVFGGNGITGLHDRALIDFSTLIVGRVGALCGNVYLSTGPSWVTDNAIYASTIPPEINLEYVRLVFSEAGLASRAGGSGQPFVNQELLNAVPVPLPPRLEQDRIVAKIDELLNHVNAAREHLAKVPKILKAFRQSVLAAACSGRLTEDWRDVNGSPDWDSATVKEVIVDKPRNGLSVKAVDYETPVRSLTLTATTSGRFDGRHFKYLDVDVPRDSHLWLRKGDILLQRGNTDEYVGIAAIYDGDDNAYIYPDLMIKIRPGPEVTSEFLWITLSEPQARQYFRDNASGSQGSMPKINQGIVEQAVIPLPSLSEQHEIVRRVEMLFKLAEKIEKRVEAATKRADRLTQAILAKAFRGELVPTEAELARREGRDYEPASVLLERIKAQRKIAAGSRKGRRRRS